MSDHEKRSFSYQFERMMKRFLSRRNVPAEDAADIVQESYRRLLEAQGKRHVHDSDAYLFQTAANLAADHHRTVAKWKVVDTELIDGTLGGVPSPETDALSTEELDVLSLAVNAMPDRMKEVFIRHRFKGQSHRLIAAELGISENTVMVHMVRALQHCRRCLLAYQEGGWPPISIAPRQTDKR